MADEAMKLVLEDVQIIFRNFEGKEGQYNKKGDRNFAVIIPDEKTAQAMLQDGWNVKYTTPREEGDEPEPYISVAVNYSNRPPNVVMMTAGARTHLTESTVEVLDWADIRTADLICRAYNWEVNGKTGVKAYLKSLYVTIEEDELEQKYGMVETTNEG